MNLTGSWSIIKNENKCSLIYLQAAAQDCNNRRRKTHRTNTHKNKWVIWTFHFLSNLFTFYLKKKIWVCFCGGCMAPNVDQWELISLPPKLSTQSFSFPNHIPLPSAPLHSLALKHNARQFFKSNINSFLLVQEWRTLTLTYNFPAPCQSIYGPPQCSMRHQNSNLRTNFGITSGSVSQCLKNLLKLDLIFYGT